MLESDNPFWQFSLAVYQAPGVAAECLALQDESGADVNILLFCAWFGSTGRILTAADLAAIEARVQPWREAAVQPLRAARRSMKALPDADIAALRKDVAALELRAEQIEQAMLFSMTPDAAATTPASEAIRRNTALLLGPGSATRLLEAALTHLEKSERS